MTTPYRPDLDDMFGQKITPLPGKDADGCTPKGRQSHPREQCRSCKGTGCTGVGKTNLASCSTCDGFGSLRLFGVFTYAS